MPDTINTIAVTGSTGLIGEALIASLASDGIGVRRLVRREIRNPATEIAWRPGEGEIDAAALEGVDAVVHLAGESIAEGRWTDAKKRRIRDSRVDGTRVLCAALAGLHDKPRVLVSGSAIGYYGDRGEETLDESSPPGDGFLPEVCVEWEQATAPAEAAGIRTAQLRTGVVLSKEGGALAKMLTPFKLGLGGKIGSGRQYMSWITLDDMVAGIRHVLATDALSGPVNLTAPRPVTNTEYTKTLGRVLGRPTIFPMPAFAARLAFGQMADDLLLASARVMPTRLEETGYQFRYHDLQETLEHALGQG
jgi:hypothetical protein